MVLVRFSAEHRAKIVEIERMLSTKYMPFAYVPNASREICSLGADYSNAYGYAQEHHTLELWLQIWLEYNKDLVSLGTPTSCKRIIDIATCIWNKCMGNVDTLRRVVTTAKAKRGKESAPGSLYWYHLLDYVLYQAFRVYQHSLIEGEMDKIMTQKSFQRKRKRKTYRSYLFKLADGLTAERMNRYFPGLRQRIDHMQPESITNLSPNELNEATGAVQPCFDDDNALSVPEGYNMLKSFLDPNSDLYKLRLNSSLNHCATKSTRTQSEGKNKGKRTIRRDCILCCSVCDDRVKVPDLSAHSRRGRKTVYYCFTCKVYLCNECFDAFHKNECPPLPQCCRGAGILTRSQRSLQQSTSISSPVHRSPKTSTRKRRSRTTTSSPNARAEISARLRGRAKNPSASSPTQSSPSPKKRKRTAEALKKSSRSRVEPRVLYSPERGNDFHSPPKLSRGGKSGWRSLFQKWTSKR